MPSDPRVAIALAALKQPTAEFRSAVQGALVQAESLLAAQSSTVEARAERAGRELGRFGAGHVSLERFAALFHDATPLDEASKKALEHATGHLRAVSAQGDSVFMAEVTPGRGLGATIDEALAVAGRAFSAIVIAELVRGGRYRPAEHDHLWNAAEFRAWNRAERRFAPPLVVEVSGADLHAGALLDFADGREKLVLVVRGDAPPAALVRCITPGTFVLQTVDGTALDVLAGFEGPAIAAVVPEGAAVFLHDPRKGAEPWQRLTVMPLPEAPKKAIGGASAWQMGEDLKILKDLARTPFAVPGVQGQKAMPAMGASDAVDRLATWLVDSAGLPRDA
jgi:hypothetical protein